MLSRKEIEELLLQERKIIRKATAHDRAIILQNVEKLLNEYQGNKEHTIKILELKAMIESAEIIVDEETETYIHYSMTITKEEKQITLQDSHWMIIPK
ncbi:hypothetical protein AAGS61_19590 [Lysinibacillus sp. KU-BSD001]|uniref:hypothetical protein n=1 Tax=Lysinibacillus sp. KU-BSD001 TaxID=3141328 RepID=UPI0036E079A8